MNACMQKPCVAAGSRISEYLGCCEILIVRGIGAKRHYDASASGGFARGLSPLHGFL